MAEPTAPPTCSSLVPPDRRAGRFRFGPILLAILGLLSVGVVYACRDRLRPAPASAATIVEPPTLVEATKLYDTSKLLASIVAPAAPRKLPTIDAFADPVPIAAPAHKPVESDTFSLQSIVVGPRSRACLINGKLCRAGDSIGKAVVKRIERDRVLIVVSYADVELRMPLPRVAAVR